MQIFVMSGNKVSLFLQAATHFYQIKNKRTKKKKMWKPVFSLNTHKVYQFELAKFRK